MIDKAIPITNELVKLVHTEEYFEKIQNLWPVIEDRPFRKDS